jgi:DNA-binding protein H-NS
LASKFKDIQAQIEALQVQATAARKQELSEVIADIKAKVKEYDLTPADIGFKKLGKAPGASKVSAKYRDPNSGKEWSGRGKPPLWIAAALKSGSAQSFLIDQSSSAPAIPAKAVKKATAKASAPKAAATKTPKKKAPAKKTAK